MQRLGERLFFDRGLSANNTLSCAMCHIPAQGFASNQSALSIGMEGRSLKRNAPTLYNVVFKKFLFHDGRETDLSAQVWGPLLDPDEMGNPAIGPLLDRLRADAVYGPAFEAAFPGEGVSMTTLGRAIAAYEATLLQGRRPFRPGDLRRRQNRAHAAGMARLRISSARAAAPLATRSARATRCSRISRGTTPARASRGARPRRRGSKVAPGVFHSVKPSELGLSAAAPKSDLGRFPITGDPKDRWAFTTPTLRGVRKPRPTCTTGVLGASTTSSSFTRAAAVPTRRSTPKSSRSI